MSRKNEHDYANDIMEAVDLAIKNPPDLKTWRRRYGADCLANAVTNIVRRAMKSAELKRKRKERENGRS